MGDPGWSSGPLGPSLNFDGLDDYVRVGERLNLVMHEALTISLWLAPTGTEGILVNKEGEYEVTLHEGKVQWALANGFPGWDWTGTEVAAPLNQWTHITLVYNGSAVQTYVNGSPVRTQSASGSIGDIAPAQNEFRIGGRQGATELFTGRIAEVRIYNRALLGEEVSTLASWVPGTGGGGSVQVRYVYGLDLVSQRRGEVTSYYGYDGLGSVRYLTDATGAIRGARFTLILPVA